MAFIHREKDDRMMCLVSEIAANKCSSKNHIDDKYAPDIVQAALNEHFISLRQDRGSYYYYIAAKGIECFEKGKAGSV